METQLKNLLLVLTPVLFLLNLAHSFFYIPHSDRTEGGAHMPHWLYYTLLTAFFGAMMFALTASSLPLMWVAVELTTLVSAPLIAYRREKGSLEAMWKYLLICSIGISLALFGTMLILHAEATHSVRWYMAGFAFILAGYGTKTGLAPFHSWLPDAHSEAPSPVSALLSGALLNCSLFAIVRFREIMPPEANHFCDTAMIALGLLSVATAAVFMVRQTDFKRLLAYSSVEHMGLAILFYAILCMTSANQPVAELFKLAFLLHIASHSLIKTALFATAGNILLAFRTRAISVVQGLQTSMKGHSRLWLTGIILICGMPPSPLFFTEYALVQIAPFPVAAAVLVLLFIVFAAMIKAALSMTMGKPLAVPEKLPRSLGAMPHFVISLLFAAIIMILFA